MSALFSVPTVIRDMAFSCPVLGRGTYQVSLALGRDQVDSGVRPGTRVATVIRVASMLWRTGRLRMVLVTAVTVAGVAALVVFGAGDGFPAARPRLLSGAAWLASSRMVLATPLHASAAQVSGQGQEADLGEPRDAVQQAATAS